MTATVSHGSTGLRWTYPELQTFTRVSGFSLVEVMIGIFLSTLLMSGIVSLISGSVSAYRLQLGQGQREESGR